jgi:hypothetical protein
MLTLDDDQRKEEEIGHTPKLLVQISWKECHNGVLCPSQLSYQVYARKGIHSLLVRTLFLTYRIVGSPS